MPIAFTLKNIPEPLYEQIKASAERHRRSVNSEMLECLQNAMMASHQNPDALIARIRAGWKDLQLPPLEPDELDRLRRAGREEF